MGKHLRQQQTALVRISSQPPDAHPFVAVLAHHERIMPQEGPWTLAVDVVSALQDYTLHLTRVGRILKRTFADQKLNSTTVNTCDPEIVKEVLATKFEDFETAGIRVKALTPLFGKGIFVTDGPQWAHCRAILRPILSRQSLDALLPRLEVHVQNLLPHIPKDGQTFDLQALTSQFTMDVAVEYLTGRSTGMLVGASGPDRSFADDYMEACVEAVKVLHLGPLHKFSFKSGTPARDRSWAYVDRYVDEVLEIRRKIKDVEKNPELDMDNDRNNFIRQLANNSDSPEMLRSHILNTLLASRDTTAALLGNLFFELARRPEIYAKLRAEAFNQLGGRLPIEDDFKNMPYLRNCINEGERHSPHPVSHIRCHGALLVLLANTRHSSPSLPLHPAQRPLSGP